MNLCNGPFNLWLQVCTHTQTTLWQLRRVQREGVRRVPRPRLPPWRTYRRVSTHILNYRILGNFHMSLIFTKLATPSKSLKFDLVKNRHKGKFPFYSYKKQKYYSVKKIKHLPIVIFTKTSHRKLSLYMV